MQEIIFYLFTFCLNKKIALIKQLINKFKYCETTKKPSPFTEMAFDI